VYYYHSRTRETVWNKPENVKIITQEEVEAMAQQQQTPGTGAATSGTTTPAQNAVAQGKDCQYCLHLLLVFRFR
jgi:hypothetical protein